MTEYEYKRETFDPDGTVRVPDNAIVLDGGRSWSAENEEWRHTWVEYLRPVDTGSEQHRRTTVDLEATLTGRQLETLQLAHQHGYFEWPREIDGEGIAELLGISQPTFSRHLRTAERKLMERLLGANGTDNTLHE